MTTLITGAGQIGAHIARILIDDAHAPVVMDVSPPQDFIGTLIPGKTLRLVQGDIRDSAALIDVIRTHRVDRIIHTAAVLPPRTEDDPVLATDVNVGGTANVLEAARLAGVERVVFCSTVGLYDMRAVRGERLREDDAVKADSVYGASKLYGELLGRNYARRRAVGFVVLRFAHIYGPAPLPTRPGIASFVGELAGACLRGVPATIQARTAIAREYVDVSDAARAAVLAATAAGITDEVFNIGTGSVHHPDEMARVACAITAGLRIDVDYAQTPAADRAAPGIPFDLSRARDQLGYAPTLDLAGGIRRFMSYLAEHRRDNDSIHQGGRT